MRKDVELFIQCQSHDCESGVAVIIIYDDMAGYTRMLGCCEGCLKKSPATEIGMIDIYHKYNNFTMVDVSPKMGFTDMEIHTPDFGAQCDRKGCDTKPEYAYIGILKLSSGIGYHFILYRCREHPLSSGKLWLTIREVGI